MVSGETSSRPTASPLLPSLSLPKGGGAIRGIGEKLTANPATGTAGLSIPVATSPGRAGFGPSLSLAYDSSAGNGPFGLGWSLSIPSITRKTDKGIPRYLEGDPETEDVFVLAGAEDLVPVYREAGDGSLVLDIVELEHARVQRYRPRVEGLFARIERWTHLSTGVTHWRVTTRDNVLSVYGQAEEARLADPDHPERVFAWLLEETRDDRGNAVWYRYKGEDGAGVDAGRASEAHRFLPGPGGSQSFLATAQRYPKRVFYGNREPLPREEAVPTHPEAWLFELVFDYGDHDEATPTTTASRGWSVRPDSFSSYRSGFELRTYRLCRRALMFHRFEELGPAPYLVRLLTAT